MSLETHIFTKLLQKYSKSCNKMDKNLAQLLSSTVDAISDLINSAEIQENDHKYDVKDILPANENGTLQAHRYYYCSPCKMSVKSSSETFQEHFYGNKHLEQLKKFEKKMNFFKSKQLKGGQQETFHRSKKERLLSGPPVAAKLPKKMDEFLRNTDFENFVAQIIFDGLQIRSSRVHERVCNMLLHRIRPRFPGVDVHPFGSIIIGMGRTGGDLDIFIDFNNCFYQKPSKRKMKDAIHQTQRCLASQPHEWSDFELVTHARTPIIRVYCKAEKIECDLSFSNGLSTCNTKLMGYFMDLHPVCKKLAAFVKYWAQELSFGLNSYLLTQMVIFYLQQEQILPSVKLLQDALNGHNVNINGWHCNFVPLTLEHLGIALATDFKRYLQGFFYYYGFEFNFNENAISILAGQAVNKSIFDHGREHQLPPTFARFAHYMASIIIEQADEVEDLFANKKPLVIQDPFELCHNVAKGVPMTKLERLITLMKQTYGILVNG